MRHRQLASTISLPFQFYDCWSSEIFSYSITYYHKSMILLTLTLCRCQISCIIKNHLLVRQGLAPSFLFWYNHSPSSFHTVCFMHLKYYIGDRSRDFTRLPINFMPTFCGKSLLGILCSPGLWWIKFSRSWPPWLQQKWWDLCDTPLPFYDYVPSLTSLVSNFLHVGIYLRPY